MTPNLAVSIAIDAAPPTRKPFMSFRRNGGLLFWRIGRLGGSLYLANRKPA